MVALSSMPGPFPLAHRGEITSLAAHYRLPARLPPTGSLAIFGGLLSYGNDCER